MADGKAPAPATAAKPWAAPTVASTPPRASHWGKLLPFVGPLVLFVIWDLVVRFGLIKAIREYDPNRDASFCTFAETCIRHRLYTVLRSAASGKHSPLNQAVPLNPSFFDANLSFAQVDPERLLIDREKTAALLENTRKLLSEFEVKILGYYLDGLTCREIAETVGKSTKSVDNAVQRLRRKIARQLLSGDISNG